MNAPLDTSVLSRRTFVLSLSAYSLFGINGCAARSKKPRSEIHDEIPTELESMLRPVAIHKADGVPRSVIDVHAHFFNARDVPVEGYLKGPLAHSQGGAIGELLRALAPIAGWLGDAAPSALNEFNELIALARKPALSAANQTQRLEYLNTIRDEYLKQLSIKLYEKLSSTDQFVEIYNTTQEKTQRRLMDRNIHAAAYPMPLDRQSLYRVMQRDLQPNEMDSKLLEMEDPPPYADGVLAFIGYMLSYRWMNLIAYQRAYSTDESAFGVDQVLGALVDFDNWLQPFPRTAHEDQIKLHQLLSQLSGGYMRPLVAYNPWSDVLDNGSTLARVLEALDERGFVGVKIYPPNGFRPYGNARFNEIPNTAGMPSAVDLDRVLYRLWEECTRRNVPVMAHTANSMGSDDAYSALGGPPGWQALIESSGAKRPVKVNLGHFGGDASGNNWNDAFAMMMSQAQGAGLFGDIAYWTELRCPGDLNRCAARNRLAELAARYPAVAERLMYGSDWLMLSAERRWNRYPFDIMKALPDGFDPDHLFGENAKRLFQYLS